MSETFSPVAAGGDSQAGQDPARADRRSARQRVLTEQVRLQASPAQRLAWELAARTDGVKLAVWCRRILTAAVGLPAAPERSDPAPVVSWSASSADADVESKGLDGQVRFQVSAETRAALDAIAHAAGITLSQLMRTLTDAHLAERPVEPLPRRRVAWRADPELLRQIGAAGNNVNQLARAVNAGRIGEPHADALLDALAAIRDELRRLEDPPRVEEDGA